LYEKFKYERVPLSLIRLDDRNPRIVSQDKLPSEEAIISYFFENEDLASFIKTISAEGRNPGAERPYVIKNGAGFVVIEGNTRVASYKLLTGQIVAPSSYSAAVPFVSQAIKDELSNVDVAIAPSRDALMTIMARAHFGRGDKSRWGYLGSRKAVYDDWKAHKSVVQLSQVFGRPQGKIQDLLLEYLLYLEALKLKWTTAEREVLLRPSIEFNPPVRFLQSTGHKQQVGVELDKVNLTINFADGDAKAKFKHLVKRTVIDEKGPSATASYDEVFADFMAPAAKPGGTTSQPQGGISAGPTPTGSLGPSAASGGSAGDQNADSGTESAGLKPNALFNYSPARNDLTLRQLLKEAKALNTKNFPAAGSALLRSVLEVLFKLIVEEKNLNPQGKLLDIEGALNLVIGPGAMGADDKKILKEFKTSHLSYINLSAHATVVPNHSRLIMVRDCMDAFVKRNV
jgi:hypothetical protein